MKRGFLRSRDERRCRSIRRAMRKYSYERVCKFYYFRIANMSRRPGNTTMNCSAKDLRLVARLFRLKSVAL